MAWPGCFLKPGGKPKPVTFLKARLSENPETAILHADLARAYEAKGWLNEARQSWQNVLQYAKGNSDLKKKAHARLSAIH